jgi:hypothetical protein
MKDKEKIGMLIGAIILCSPYTFVVVVGAVFLLVGFVSSF